MTEAERLAERLEELLAKATPGPWQVYKHPVCKIEDALEELTYQVVHTDPLANHLFLLDADGKCPATTGCGPTSEDNAALIVEAVNALPALITALRSQAEELERLRGALGELSDYETDRASMWADQHNEWTKDEMHKIARAALGER